MVLTAMKVSFFFFYGALAHFLGLGLPNLLSSLLLPFSSMSGAIYGIPPDSIRPIYL
jgi:hypothetical protein